MVETNAKCRIGRCRHAEHCLLRKVKGNEKWVQRKRCGTGSRKRDVRHRSVIVRSTCPRRAPLLPKCQWIGGKRQHILTRSKRRVSLRHIYVAQIPGHCRARESRLPLPPMIHIYSRYSTNNRTSGLLGLERRSFQTTFVGNLWCRD